MKANEQSRRRFLKSAVTLSAAAAAFPTILTKPAAGSAAKQVTPASPGEKVNLACVGIGAQGANDIKEMAKTGLCNFIAFCDTDMGGPATLDILKTYPDVPRFQDFRVMFDTMGNEIDAVLIAIPDFAHFPVAMLAMSLGKHVYVEKPMGRTFHEVQLMMNAAKKYNVVTQMGNQGHSEANYFQFKTWVEAGIIKDVTAFTGHMNSSRRWHGWDTSIIKYPAGEPLPQTLDWDTWLGTADEHEYNHDYVNGQWRCWFDFGMGALGDWGAHIMDSVHQFLNLGLPYEIEPLKVTGWNPFFFPQSETLLYKFPARGNMPALDLTWYDGQDNLPPLPKGYGGEVTGDPNIPAASNGPQKAPRLGPGKIMYSKDLTFKGGTHGATLSIIPSEKAKEMQSKLPEVPKSPSNHYKNFLLGCKGLEQTRSSFDISGPLSQVFNLGVIAAQLNTKLMFDRQKKVITNHPLANQMLVGKAPRKGWEQYYEL
ncbi:MAG: Gfo/Idh/MocA family oxidoreductase [Bacteroidales bacterium]